MAVARDQQVFRIRTDATAAEGGTPVWAAAQNSVVSPPIDTPFRIRFAIANTGATNAGSSAYALWVSQNGGAYAVMTTTTTAPVYSTDATAGASADDATLTTSLLTGASGTYQTGKYDTTSATSNIILLAGDYIEVEYAFKINSRYTKTGDTFAFRVYALSTPLESYSQTPTLTIAQGVTTAQVTQASVEEFYPLPYVAPQAKVTQTSIEQWWAGNPSAQITNLGVDVWGIGSPSAQVSTFMVEEWATAAAGSIIATITSLGSEIWVAAPTVIGGAGAADGSSNVSGASGTIVTGAGAADGSSNVSGASTGITSGAGAADGSSNVSGVGGTIVSGAGHADGSSNVAGTATTISARRTGAAALMLGL